MRVEEGILYRDGFGLRYRVEGEGVPLLVVGSAVYYPRVFARELRETFRMIFVDHRGFAEVSKGYGVEEYRLERIVEDIEAVREHLGLEDFVIVGHSGHAFMVLAYAQTYPQYVRGVVLLNTAPSNSRERQEQSIEAFEERAEPERKWQFEHDFAQLPADIAREPERRFVHMCIRMGAHSFYDYRFDATPQWEGVQTNMDVMDYLWGVAFAQIDLRDELEGVDKPVLLGLGRYDYLVGPLELWEGIEEKRGNVRKVIFEHSGHSPMFEEPELFGRVLREWVDVVR